jgi:hypothetical protein
MRGAGVADGGFSATVRHGREGKGGNGFGQHDGLVAAIRLGGAAWGEDWTESDAVTFSART